MTQLFVVRHGQTDWNVARRYQGQKDIPLNIEGIRQAHSLATLLSGETFSAIYSSDLCRAMQTAQILQKGRNIPIIPDQRLREIGFGEWEGAYLADIKEKYPQAFPYNGRDITTPFAPGGESVQTVALRMKAVADEINQLYPDDNALVVTHGMAAATLYCQSKHISLAEAHKWVPDNALVIQISWLLEAKPI
jgi:broad specificity phosphatase PhoE